MNEHEANNPGQSLPFLKIWTESFAKLAQAAFTFSPEAVPPEMLRQVRSGMFQALAQSWDEFLRSPQFMEGMKQMMDNAVAFRKLNTEFLTKARHELGGVAQDDVQGLIGAVRHTEKRISERLDALSNQIAALNRRLDGIESSKATAPASSAEPSPRAGRGRTGAKGQSRTKSGS